MMCTATSKKAASASSLKGAVLGNYKTGTGGTLKTSVLREIVA